MRRVRTRFAPSPTGPLHIGGVRTALYSYLFAKKHGGDFILRIEDTDTAREVAGSEEIINESLKWCGITPDEGVHEGGNYGPYKQSLRKDLYIDHALKLIENGSAYYAFDTEDEISQWREASALKNNGISVSYNFVTRNEMKNSLTLTKEAVDNLLKDKMPYVIRLKVEETDDVTFHDIVRDEVTFRSSQLDDRVLLKSDGMPTYHLANVVDDYFMQITHVIRGEEWLASTPHHVLLYQAFGWEKEMPQFAHLPLLLKPDGKGKLSKRDGDRLGFPVFCASWKNPLTGEISEGYREKGFQSQAFVNFIAMLGWNDGTEKEVFSMEELIQLFSLERVHKAGAKFNYEKALWYNQQYIHKMPLDMIVDSVKAEILKCNPTVSDIFVEKYCQLFQDRVHFLYELKDIGKYLYGPIEDYDRETLRKKWTDATASFLKTYIDKLSEIEFHDAIEIEEFTKREMEANQLSMGAILPVLRIGLTGITKGPSVFETIILLGSRESISRLKNIEKIIS